MLETLLPTDPILLLAVVDGPFSALPKDVKAWFGAAKDNRVELARPLASQRSAFFEPLLRDVARKPNEFADGVKRRKRILEELPIAPPLEPRKPTAAELAVQEENDQKTIALLKFRLGPILAEMKRKFKRFTKRATVRSLPPIWSINQGTNVVGLLFFRRNITLSPMRMGSDMHLRWMQVRALFHLHSKYLTASSISQEKGQVPNLLNQSPNPRNRSCCRGHRSMTWI